MRAFIRGSLVLVWFCVVGLASSVAADELATLWQQELTAARQAKSRSDYEAANLAYDRALVRAEQLGEQDARLAQTLEEMSSSYAQQKNRERAIELQQRALELRVASSRPGAAAQAHMRLGKLYIRFASPELAEAHLREALAFREAAANADTAGVEGALRELVSLIEDLRADDPEIETLHRRLIDLRDTPQHRARLASYYSDQGQRELAIEQLQLAIDLEAGRKAVDARQLVSLTTKLAEQYRVLGMLADAESWMERAVETREARLGADHPYLAFSLRQLAAILIEDERYNEAEALLLRARDLNAAAWGLAADQCSCQTDDLLEQVHRALGREPDAPPAPVTEVAGHGEPDDEQLAAEEIERLHEELTRLAKEGRVEEAKEQAETALALVEQLHGRSSLPYVAGLDRLAQLLRQQRQLDQAEELHRQRLAILEGLVEADDLRLAPVLADLFAIARDRKRVDDAEQLALREMTIRDGSGQNIKVARALEMLGSLLLADGRVARAESYFTHAAERWQAFAGEDAPEIVRALTSSAKSQVRLGNLAEAEALLRELLERTTERRYPDTNQQIQILQALKDALQKLDRTKAATEVGAELDRVRALRRDYTPAAAKATLEEPAALEK